MVEVVQRVGEMQKVICPVCTRLVLASKGEIVGHRVNGVACKGNYAGYPASQEYLTPKGIRHYLAIAPLCSECKEVTLLFRKWRELGMCAKCWRLKCKLEA